MTWWQIVLVVLGLIGTAGFIAKGLFEIGLKIYVKVKSLIDNKQWSKLVKIVLVACEKAEEIGGSSQSKKDKAMEIVKATLKEIGIDETYWIDELSAFIDECIEFHNKLKDKESGK